jgi:galactose mutarotase-like enzyme
METINYNGISLLRWDCGPSTFLARPESGARLMNWNLRMSDGSIRDIIHWPEDADFNRFAKVRGGNPILFPFAARSFHQGEMGYWRDQSGAVRPMPMHGFAREGAFRLLEADASGFSAELQPTEAHRDAYPFDYRFTVRYVFAETAFKVYLKLENLGDQPLMWSAGHHFYFTLPWHPQHTRDDYTFKMPAKQCFTHSPNGALQAVDKGWDQDCSFGHPHICDRIYTDLTADSAIFGPKDGAETIGIRLLQDSETASTDNAFVVWTEAEDSPFYCVEPWMGPPNSAEHGKGLHTVGPSESATFGVEVALR